MRVILNFGNTNLIQITGNSNYFKLSLVLFLLIGISQFLGCKVVQKNNLQSQMTKNDSLENRIDEKKTKKVTDINLEKNRSLWLESKIVDYNITVIGTKGGNIIYSKVLIEVRNGKGSLIEPIPKVDKIRLEIYRDLDTIEKFFDAIQRELENNSDVKVKYNKKFGYPEEFLVSNLKKGVDAWYGMAVKKLEIVRVN
jgi:hypothetical protein